MFDARITEVLVLDAIEQVAAAARTPETASVNTFMAQVLYTPPQFMGLGVVPCHSYVCRLCCSLMHEERRVGWLQ